MKKLFGCFGLIVISVITFVGLLFFNELWYNYCVFLSPITLIGVQIKSKQVIYKEVTNV